MNSPSLTTVLIPPAKGTSIGDNRAARPPGACPRKGGQHDETGENSRPINGEDSTPAHSVSSEGHAVMSVKVRPEPKDSGSEAREALWRESKTAEPSDNILERSMREASGCNVQ